MFCVQNADVKHVVVTAEWTGEDLPGRRRRIGEVLVDQGVLTEAQLSDLLISQMDPSRTVRPRLGNLVVDSGMATERQVANALATALSLPLADLTQIPLDEEAARRLPRAFSERNGMLILKATGETIDVATTDPTNIVALDDIRTRTGARDVRLYVATQAQLTDKIARAWATSDDGEVVALLDALGETVDDFADAGIYDGGVESAPIVRLVDGLIADAVSQRASDVHVEAGISESRVRFRVDGVLRDVLTVPRGAHASLVSRLKILGGLDIAERRIPQDGRARLGVAGRQVEARLSTLPSMHGEKVVMRLLARAADVPATDELGLDPQQRATLLETMESPQGLVLVTGPTGSGKTSTLYALLANANTPERNIVTLEDPVEIDMPGITQVQINPRTGLTFARGLRSVLRQDPDMVLVGEVRDQETAELALQASLTGHLVLTTLHTNDAVAALTRLMDMGVEAFLVASSLSLVAAQRLVRRPCTECAAPYTPPGRVLTQLGLTHADLADATPLMGAGCDNCSNTGYRGRMAVFEVLPITPTIRAVLLATPSEKALAAAARASGVVSLRSAALAAAARGDTTYEEVLRVTSGSTTRLAPHRCRNCDRPAPEDIGEDQVCCPWCGTSSDDSISCPNCHRRSSVGWTICPYCRASLVTSALPRVLVVEPQPNAANALQADLTGRAEVVSATCMDDALRLLDTTQFVATLLDQTMVDMPLDDFMALLSEDELTAKMPVLALPEAAGLPALAEQLASMGSASN